MTLLIVLLILLCQFAGISSAFSVQYLHNEHPSGSQIKHHHIHLFHTGNEHETSPSKPSVHQHSHQSDISFNATETQQDILQSNVPSSTLANAVSEHEHGSHSHSPSHPPVESLFVAEFTHTSTLSDNDIAYLTLQYAPPIPPPYQ
ncbi:hypothetical protein L2737_16955 [Shewanella electrodiphila]|uniref:Uncharacterized protein n=1 Tax=Shewanella electrodiphila TaxID=934143 RepID=A0ABT0KT16_9GAMM|nr:hypothetical protein [Shewanella electrodiphila]MCL1046990.1 hypothetical protein [Shewanella electrodiphila]